MNLSGSFCIPKQRFCHSGKGFSLSQWQHLGTRETPFPYRETPFSHGETPLVLKTAFSALCFLLDGGIPRCGGVKNVATAANWAQKRVTCRVPSVSTAFARAFRTAKSKVQSSAGAFPCGNGTVSFSVFLFSSCRP